MLGLVSIIGLAKFVTLSHRNCKVQNQHSVYTRPLGLIECQNLMVPKPYSVIDYICIKVLIMITKTQLINTLSNLPEDLTG